MWNMYTILILYFGHEKLCRRDTELETLLDENARVLEWCATPRKQCVRWLGTYVHESLFYRPEVGDRKLNAFHNRNASAAAAARKKPHHEEKH